MNNLIEKILRRVFVEYAALLIARFYKLFGKNGNHYQRLVYHLLTQKMNLQVVNDGLVFDGTSKSPASRAERLLTKEPDTLYWINQNMNEGDVLYDIGANIGVYSLYASKRNIKVVAFEPESSTYAILNKNIFLNKMTENISALNLAIHDQDCISNLNLSMFEPGRSSHNFHDELDHDHKHFTPVFKQAVIGMRIDTLLKLYKLPFPNHIKIDVDGNEHKIIEGLGEVLFDKRLRSIAIEIHTHLNIHLTIPDLLEDAGFSRLNGKKYKNDEYKTIGTPNYFFVR